MVGLPCLPLVVRGHVHASQLFQAPNPKLILPVSLNNTGREINEEIHWQFFHLLEVLAVLEVLD